MINVKYYEQRSAYDADKPNLILPNVSYCEDTDEVFYNPKPHDYSNDYITFVAEEDGTFKFKNNSVNYSVDGGETWSELASNTDSPTVQTGSKIMFKATLTPSTSYPYGIGAFSSTSRFTAQGNVMSLLYGDGFKGQTSLSGKEYAFYRLFYNCTGLTSTENISLPATILATNCYFSMFQGCTSLTTAPVLPATTLVSNCYNSMFCGCTSLTTAQSTLPATTLGNDCYNGMLSRCTSLTAAPQLPATTLASNCYAGMFAGCTSLTTAPVLPATTLVEYCYNYMFTGCTNLNSITCLATDASAVNCTNNWVNGVAASGTFIKADSMSSWTTGNSGIPTGWEVQDKNASQYLTFVAEEDGTFSFNKKGTGDDIQYSVNDGETWTTLASNTDSPTVQTGSKIMFKAILTPTSNGIGTFSSTGSFTAQGNAMSLLYGDNFIGQTSLSEKNHAFYDLFNNCTSLTSAENMSLPATTLGGECYDSMFFGCLSLTTAPSLPATTLGNYCYSYMFMNCTSLTSAPKLPATTLISGCYQYMFRGCTSLTTAPSLPATTLASYCYRHMFYGCANLNNITCLATNTSASTCTNNWVSGVAASGTFIKAASMTDWTTGNDGIPSGWTVQDYQP